MGCYLLKKQRKSVQISVTREKDMMATKTVAKFLASASFSGFSKGVWDVLSNESPVDLTDAEGTVLFCW
jgi:hypothetical protein